MNSLVTVTIYCGNYTQFRSYLPDIAKLAIVPDCNYDMGHVVFEKALAFFRETGPVCVFTNNELWYYAARVAASDRYSNAEFCFVLFQEYCTGPVILPIDSNGNINSNGYGVEFYGGIDRALSAVLHLARSHKKSRR